MTGPCSSRQSYTTAALVSAPFPPRPQTESWRLRLCTEQLGLPGPDKSWKCLKSLPPVLFFQRQPAAMVDTDLHRNWELGLGGLIAAPHRFIVCLQIL